MVLIRTIDPSTLDGRTRRGRKKLMAELIEVPSYATFYDPALEREIAPHKELFRALLEERMNGRLSVDPLLETVAA